MWLYFILPENGRNNKKVLAIKNVDKIAIVEIYKSIKYY